MAINDTVNDLAMCGAMAKYLTLSFIIEEGFSMEEFGDVIHFIRDATRGGVVSVLNEVAGLTRLGYHLNQKIFRLTNKWKRLVKCWVSPPSM